MVDKILKRINSTRFALIILLIVLVISISFLTRIGLLVYSFSSFDFTLANIGGVVFIGLFYDIINAGYFCIPLLLLLWLVPEKIYVSKGFRITLFTLFLIFNFLLLFNAAAEGLFWDEFDTRFNFIAVDYLVYTTEVIGNIRQSYPIEWIIAFILLVSVALTFALRKRIHNADQVPMRFRQRSTWFLAFISFPILSFLIVNTRIHHFSANTYANELAANGMYELFAAYRNNELDYDQFYPHASKIEKKTPNIVQAAHVPESKNNTFQLKHDVVSLGAEKKLNVVLISVESLSAEFLNAFGSDKNITPFLDSLAEKSLLFTNLYATGTRTVRGLEALSLSIPPTPGQSIVRRPNNENLFTLSSVFNSKGYKSKFIYGGYGYFDNMGYYFENNGYEVVDRSALADEEIDYENIWGVADENLFTLALREIDKSVANNTPAFTHVMTTSNHRPYTYPEGRIDIPSHTGREGAVKYTDYSIGKFIKEAGKKPWFSNTVFIIVADHCASSAGKTELPVSKYHIPMLIFSPANVEAGRQERLMSQIDVGPTLLGMLNFSYQSKFFGEDINSQPLGHERAFISTYQLLGYLKKDSLAILSPNKAPEVFLTDKDGEVLRKITPDASALPVTQEAIVWYQTASHSFKEGALKN